jgi:hypothetical protein
MIVVKYFTLCSKTTLSLSGIVAEKDWAEIFTQCRVSFCMSVFVLYNHVPSVRMPRETASSKTISYYDHGIV